MIRTLYEYQIESNATIMSGVLEYADLSTTIATIDSDVRLGPLTTRLIDAYTGLADGNTINTESAWWDLQNRIQELSTTITTLTDLDSGLVGATDLVQQDILVKIYNILENTDYTTVVAAVTAYIQEVSLATVERDTLEARYPWLLSYRGVDTTDTRPIPVGVIPKSVKKLLIAKVRDTEVRTSEDTLADLAKMNSLLFSMVSSMYTAMPTATKDLIPAAERGLIDYATTQFALVQTRADRQLLVEGTALVDKLFKRESDIANIVDRLLP